MSHQDLNECLRILKEKPAWFIQKEDIAKKLQCLETIQQLGTTITIYEIYSFLHSNNVLIQTKTAETIVHLFGRLRSLNAYNEAPKHLQVKLRDIDLFLSDFEEEISVKLLSMASLNSSGYVREKAVVAMGRLKNKAGLKFILLRLGDWVPEVRNAATAAIDSFLEPRYLDVWLQELPTIDWLLKVQRVDLSDIHHLINAFILDGVDEPGFQHRINALNESSRHRFYKLYIATKPLTPELVGLLSRDGNFLVRHLLLRQLPVFDTATQEKLIGLFLRDHAARLRLEALYASKKFAPAFNERIHGLLSDENASVRELSRGLLKMESPEAASLYRQRITGREMLAGSLAGLAETGNAADLPTFETHLQHSNRMMVLACLAAIQRFDEPRAKQRALELLTHASRRVRELAKDILARRCDRETLLRIRQRYATADPALRKTILPLYQQIGGWPVAGDFLLALRDEDNSIQELGWRHIESWRQKSTRLFTAIPEAEKERAATIFHSLDRTRLQMGIWREKLLADVSFILGLQGLTLRVFFDTASIPLRLSF